MNRRALKKNMNYLVQELISECLWIIHCEQPANVVDAENVIDNILILQSEMLARASHPDKRYAKKYFKKLRTDFLTRVEEITEQIKNLA